MGHSLRLRDAFHTDGSMAIEYGLILPVLLLFTFGLVDAGRLLWTNITLTRATEVAARCGAVGAVNTITCPGTSTQATGMAEAWGISNIPDLTFTPTSAATCGFRVVGTCTFQFVVPWFPQFSASAPFGSTTMPLKATACYPNQH